ncbi:hypothetical protein H0H92_008996, partial [Tricholoma furcatifolium]
PEVLAPGATLIVYLNTPTGKVPCWMSPELYALESKNVILPLERMSVFFTQAKATTGSMISKDKFLEFIVEFGQHENLTYKLENGREWVKVSIQGLCANRERFFNKVRKWKRELASDLNRGFEIAPR